MSENDPETTDQTEPRAEPVDDSTAAPPEDPTAAVPDEGAVDPQPNPDDTPSEASGEGVPVEAVEAPRRRGRRRAGRATAAPPPASAQEESRDADLPQVAAAVAEVREESLRRADPSTAPDDVDPDDAAALVADPEALADALEADAERDRHAGEPDVDDAPADRDQDGADQQEDQADEEVDPQGLGEDAAGAEGEAPRAAPVSPVIPLFQEPDPEAVAPRRRRRAAQRPSGAPQEPADESVPPAQVADDQDRSPDDEDAPDAERPAGDGEDAAARGGASVGTGRRRRRRGRGRSRGAGEDGGDEDAGQDESAQDDGDGEARDGGASGDPEDAPGDEADDTDDTEDGGAGRSRRRRRGRRGRGRARDDEADGEDGEGAAPTSDPADGDADEGSGASDETTDDEAGSGSSRRRRRRRGGRSGSGSGDDTGGGSGGSGRSGRSGRSGSGGGGRSGDDGDDGVRGITGSTRMEAKRQRRRDGRDSGRTRAPILSEAEFLARRDAVERVMVVRQRADRVQIGVLEDGVLVEHFTASDADRSMIGEVYVGRVQNVLPSMEAAFVDVGRGRNGVLYAGDVDWARLGVSGGDRQISRALKSGADVLVQVSKDPVGHKGARLTGQVSLPGRYVVYVPDGSSSGISRKLPEEERARLKAVLKKAVPAGASVIVRTAAEGASEADLQRDVARLQAQWESISSRARSVRGPVQLYSEPDLLVKVVRDLFNEDVARLVVAGDEAWETVRSYVESVAPDLVDRLVHHEGDEDVFEAHRVGEQLAKALDRTVHLPSGGSLVIDHTEAMTVVDVNTGRYTGQGGNLEETVTRNNLEAAEEVVRQLRLRDVGGMIVIDFIDMVLEHNRELVLTRLTECLGRDRTKHQVAEVTSLGLVQMTRKRVGQSLLVEFSEQCRTCGGLGRVVHEEPVLGGSGAERAPGSRVPAPGATNAAAATALVAAASARAKGRGGASPTGVGDAEAADDAVDADVVDADAIDADVVDDEVAADDAVAQLEVVEPATDPEPEGVVGTAVPDADLDGGAAQDVAAHDGAAHDGAAQDGAAADVAQHDTAALDPEAPDLAPQDLAAQEVPPADEAVLAQEALATGPFDGAPAVLEGDPRSDGAAPADAGPDLTQDDPASQEDATAAEAVQ